jgi:hypothetical protein
MGMQAPDLAKTRFVEDLHKADIKKICVGETELLVYSLELRMGDRWIY